MGNFRNRGRREGAAANAGAGYGSGYGASGGSGFGGDGAPGRGRLPSYRAAFGNAGGRSDPDAAQPKRRPAFQERRDNALAADAKMSVEPLPAGGNARVGWLYNMVAATVEEPSTKRPVQAVDLFFIPDDGGADFRATVIARPYMLVAVPAFAAREAEVSLRRTFADAIAEVSQVRLEDTSEPNHLAVDEKRLFLKVEVRTSFELRDIKHVLLPRILRNAERKTRAAAIDPSLRGLGSVAAVSAGVANTDGLDYIEDIREHDVAPVNRFAIDKKINVGYWYSVTPGGVEGDIANVPDITAEDGSGQLQRADPDISEHAANSFSSARLVKLPDIVERANPVVLAYDIECTKEPLKFPDAESGDQVMMISWMVDGRGYLGINRKVVSADIDGFEYAPHKSYRGDFEVFNEPDEKALLLRFFVEVRLAAPRVFVTYNGDYFDWPFVETRARILGLDMGDEIGMSTNMDSSDMTPQTSGRTAVHMDVFHWVNRDSYLPQGSRGLKAVTRALLGFEPEEIPPEQMMDAARDAPHEMARYSVSDAVCTYYLYMKYVHPFTFSLCNIIPLAPDDVLRKGSGTLCEMLLMCQASEKRIVAPNKHDDSAIGKLTKEGHVLESETYIGGHVEALRTGVYRSDLPNKFSIDMSALDDLERSLDDTMKFAIEVEGGVQLDNIVNYDEVRQQIVDGLAALRAKPERDENPLIYHLDVSAMYPNIILTNRLQPHAIVSSNQCAACDFNGMSDCQRTMEWTWRGEYFPATRGEAEMIQRRAAQDEREAEVRALSAESEQGSGNVAIEEVRNGEFRGDRSRFRGGKRGGRAGYRSLSSRNGHGGDRGGSAFDLAGVTNGSGASVTPSSFPSFADVSARRNVSFRKRLKDYCRTNYRRTLDTRVESKPATVCQRENPFYVDTVRAFRDRRYEYKALLKKQKIALCAAKESDDAARIAESERLIVLYDSLQLAHKCILNSFYGYVMRKGARWYSMEMAGIVTHTGALIIRRAREFIERIGLPLELDTDGIWCMLPISFPDKFTLKTSSGKVLPMSYICSVFNADVAANFTNHQYQDLKDSDTLEYSKRSECSILFEVDGPYRAMVLPAALEEGKTIKKRYAVFNDDGSLAELKGFEIKRRGELKLIKEFQGEIFDKFLDGSTLKECYESVGATCNKWLTVLTSEGEGMTDDAILELLVEQNNMSKPLEEYVKLGQKSLAITCATRMMAFLGEAVAANAGLATMYIVSSQPDDAQVTDRAIPVKVFELGNEKQRDNLLRKWTKQADANRLELRNLIDWNYYKGRLANAVLKIVSIPAALQAQDNPVPGIEYPAWLVKRCRELQDTRKQRAVTSFFSMLPKGKKASIVDIKPLQDTAQDTDRLEMVDIEDMPLLQWTQAKRTARRNIAKVTRRKKEEQAAKRLARDCTRGVSASGFRSRATDPTTREREARSALIALLNAPHPEKRNDFKGWVKHAKTVWRAQRQARVQRYVLKRALEGGGDGYGFGDGEEDDSAGGGDGRSAEDARRFGGVGERPRQRRRKDAGTAVVDYAPANFFADAVRRVTPYFMPSRVPPLVGRGVMWQVISIAPRVNSPGEFRMWVLPTLRDGKLYLAGEMHCVPLRVNRTLHFNSRNDKVPMIGNAVIEKSSSTLPRSRPRQNVYRVEIPETRFVAKDKELSCALTDALSVDTVFGTKTPLSYDAILEIGILCAPRPGNRFARNGTTSSQKILAKGLNLDDIVAKNAENIPYLVSSHESNAQPLLNQAFLYGAHAVDNTSRALYALVAPASKQVLVVVVTPAKNVRVNLANVWSKVVAARRREQGFGVARSSHHSEHNAEGNVSDDDMMNLDDAVEGDDGDNSYDNDDSEEPTQDDPDLALPADVHFDVRSAKTRAEAWTELNNALQRLRDGRGTAGIRGISRGGGRCTIVLAQWPANAPIAPGEQVDVAALSSGNDAAFTSSVSGHLEECLPALSGFPVVRIASNSGDGNFQPLGWETPTASLAFSRFIEIYNWLPNQLTFSQFAGIPVGNISITDVHSQALDILVGRELRNQDQVLWASEGARPDLGGAEEEDNLASEESVPVPEFSNPGSYRTVCIDTELSDLAVATILAASHVNQLEGTDLAFDAAANPSAKALAMDSPGVRENDSTKFDPSAREGEIGGKSVAPLDEMAGSAPAFRVVKSLVSRWERLAVGANRDVALVSKGLLDHFYRWIGSETSLLHDPALARFLSWLIRKMFWQLLAELRELGAGIVFASTSRLILSTPKTKAVDALRYAGFLERTIKSKPLFQHLRFEPLLAINSGMLFVDRFNYGAVPAPEEESILSGEYTAVAASSTDRSQMVLSRRTYGSVDIPHARMTWDIARYLPIPVAVLLSQVVEEFLRRPMLDRLRLEEEEDVHFAEQEMEAQQQAARLLQLQYEEDMNALVHMEASDENDKVNATKITALTAPVLCTTVGKPEMVSKYPRRKLKPRGDGYAEEVKALVRSMTGDLLEKVQEIRQKAPLLQFPDVPTSLDICANGRRNPALEFVRTLCHILSLDPASIEEVANLRRSLLRLLGVREFAKEAQFVDPALPLLLRNVICSYCNAVVDLDLARDSRLWDPSSSEGRDIDDDGNGHGPAPWSCEYCSYPHDMSGIELALIRDAQRMVVSYQVQDLQCKKCRLVKRDNMSTHCGCSGAAYELVVDMDAFYKSLRSLRSVAAFHNFQLLAETVEWITLSCTR
jgi:DNA polymerase elongation subunit (family B)